jgi:4,5-dihydroxyphthalate decarboxylase
MVMLAVSLLMNDFDHIAPLASGDVVPEGIDLTFERRSPINRFIEDPSFDAGEMSLGKYLIRMARGDHEFVGIPIFPMREFRHRCFFTRRGSGIQSLQDLAGKRMGIDAWSASGNTWGRAALRDAGVDIRAMQWFVGPIDRERMGPTGSAEQTALPPYAQPVSPGENLRDLLVAGRLDALLVPYTPAGFYEPDSPIVRVIEDYARAEREYYRRTGIYPAHHIIGIRRASFERNPWIARNIYDALERSRLLWHDRRWHFPDTTPWLLEAIEDVTRLIGPDWRPNGVAPNSHMIAALCEEQYAQGLVTERYDPAMAFASFAQS